MRSNRSAGQMPLPAALTAAQRRTALGFRDVVGSPMQGRTLMLDELAVLLTDGGAQTTRAEYGQAVVEGNILGKSSAMNRRKTAKLLAQLYGLDAKRPVFRALRHFWRVDPRAHGTIAMLAALTRDHVLRASWSVVGELPHGSPLRLDLLSDALRGALPQLSPKSLRSLRANVASSWTQSGHLRGVVRKVRSRPEVTPTAVAMALFIGYLQGRRGLRLFDTLWVQVLELTEAELMAQATSASRQGLLHLLAAGSVIEVRFPGLLTDAEEELSHEPA
jgi:hypothetical protein